MPDSKTSTMGLPVTRFVLSQWALSRSLSCPIPELPNPWPARCCRRASLWSLRAVTQSRTTTWRRARAISSMVSSGGRHGNFARLPFEASKLEVRLQMCRRKIQRCVKQWGICLPLSESAVPELWQEPRAAFGIEESWTWHVLKVDGRLTHCDIKIFSIYYLQNSI